MTAERRSFTKAGWTRDFGSTPRVPRDADYAAGFAAAERHYDPSDDGELYICEHCVSALIDRRN